MIIDDRYNGGGFVPDDMAFEIGQPVLNWWSLRHRELAPQPDYAFEGPRVMLINGYSSSGGDAFPFYFRELELGTLMGQRTWGGLVGYSGTPRLVDGGGMAVPNFAFVNRRGEWDVEAYGVEPDVEVFDDPTLIQAGREPMLEAAVAHLLHQLEAEPPPARPPVPAGPDRRGLVDPADAPRSEPDDR
jgi:tricorn protease